MSPESPDPLQPEEKPKTISDYTTAELVEFAQRAAYDPEATPTQATRIVGNITTELSRRSQMLAELRENKRIIEAKHARNKRLTAEEIAAWKDASLTLNDYADFNQHVQTVNGVRESLSSDEPRSA